MSTPERAFSNLLLVKQILDELEVFFWLDGGTLLGAYRDGDFCPDDHNDIDLSAWAADKRKIPQIVTMARSQGFRLYHHWDGDARAPGMAPEIALTKDGLKIDVFFFETTGDMTWHLLYKNEVGTAVVTPVWMLKEFEDLGFRGEVFNCPVEAKAYLQHRYGTWWIPKHRSTYTSTDNSHLLARDPEYRYWDE